MFLSQTFITDFGDSAVTGAVTLVTACIFFLTKNKSAAFALLLAFGISVALTAGAKIILYNYPVFPDSLNLHSPSGHTAVSMAVYGIFAMIVASPLKKRYRFLAYLIAVVLIASISVTRVSLGRHSVAEVVCGFIIGAAVCGAVLKTPLYRKPVIINRCILLAVAFATLILVHGTRLPAEPLIDNIAEHLG